MSGDEPTLVMGMQSEDGWVEYAQSLLRHHLGSHPSVTGVFDDWTFQAVKEFQEKMQISPVDGKIGNQTWSVLRSEPERADVGAAGNGRDYVEKGIELRFAPGVTHYVGFMGHDDAAVVELFSVGDRFPTPDEFKVALWVKKPSGESIAAEPVVQEGGGLKYDVVVPKVAGGVTGRYEVLAQVQVPGESGGDTVQAEFDVHEFP